MTHLKDRKHRGEGSGDEYDPFYHIQDRSTRKSSERIPSLTGGRNIHVVGNEETAVYYSYAWSPPVIDINEQYPLPLDQTLAIATDCGLHHPTRKGKPRVITCSFRIRYRQDNREQIAFRTVAKLTSIQAMLTEIEILRQHYAQQEADWGLITEEDINWAKARNIEHNYGLRNIENENRFSDVFRERYDEIKEALLWRAAEHNHTIDSLVSIVSPELGLRYSNVVDFCGHLIFNRIFAVDMSEEISNSKTIIRPY